MHERLTGLFRRREMDKRYWAIVKGVPEPRQGIINMPLAEVELSDGRHRMTGRWKESCTYTFRQTSASLTTSLLPSLQQKSSLSRIF